MSRKDYIAIAETLRYQLDAHLGQSENDHASGVFDAAKALATTFGNDDPNFDREKFMRAVLVGNDPGDNSLVTKGVHTDALTGHVVIPV